MIVTPAQYLLRFDDLCPTVSATRWQLFRALISEFGLCPILAVVPGNRDPALAVSPPDPHFWDQMRALESAGAAIALHGYRHLCVSRGRSLLNLARTSEFAGIAPAVQRQWIREGLGILRNHGLNPSIFVAPRHGFDLHTLASLRSEGIRLLSDGFARVPHLRGGLTWIPQQLWAPVPKPNGLWTICIHPNTATDEQIAALRAFLRARSAQFTSVDRLLAEFQPTTLTLAGRIHEEIALCRLKTSRAVSAIRFTLFRSSKSA